jgi:hypothetical protein
MSTGTRWAIFTLVGIAAWIGATVYVAATNPDPSDAEPILRTFAFGGAAFFGVVLLAAAWEVRRSQFGTNLRLYQRLALQPVSRKVVRRLTRRTTRTTYVYLVFTGATTGLLLAAIAGGEAGPYRLLLGLGFVLVLIWAAYSVVALGKAYGGASELLAPLGLKITAVPNWHFRSTGGGDLVGALTMAGVRHGRQVNVGQTAGSAVTSIEGAYGQRSVRAVAQLAALTGEAAKHWRNVEASAGAAGVTVRRRGNGAGRWFLHDLLLAECLADERAPGGTTPPGVRIAAP